MSITTDDIREEPGVKHQRYLWHLMVPVTAYGDQADVDVMDRLTTLANACIGGILIEGDGLPGKVVCGKETASTLQPLDSDGDRETGPEGIITEFMPTVVNRAIGYDERVQAAKAIVNALLFLRPRP